MTEVGCTWRHRVNLAKKLTALSSTRLIRSFWMSKSWSRCHLILQSSLDLRLEKSPEEVWEEMLVMRLHNYSQATMIRCLDQRMFRLKKELKSCKRSTRRKSVEIQLFCNLSHDHSIRIILMLSHKLIKRKSKLLRNFKSSRKAINYINNRRLKKYRWNSKLGHWIQRTTTWRWVTPLKAINCQSSSQWQMI